MRIGIGGGGAGVRGVVRKRVDLLGYMGSLRGSTLLT